MKREHLYPAIPYTEVKVTTGIDNLAQFAKDKRITYAQLKDANPWLRDTSLMNKSGRTYILKIPTQAGMHYNPHKNCSAQQELGNKLNTKSASRVKYFQYRTGMSCLCLRGFSLSLIQIALK